MKPRPESTTDNINRETDRIVARMRRIAAQQLLDVLTQQKPLTEEETRRNLAILRQKPSSPSATTPPPQHKAQPDTDSPQPVRTLTRSETTALLPAIENRQLRRGKKKKERLDMRRAARLIQPSLE